MEFRSEPILSFHGVFASALDAQKLENVGMVHARQLVNVLLGFPGGFVLKRKYFDGHDSRRVTVQRLPPAPPNRAKFAPRPYLQQIDGFVHLQAVDACCPRAPTSLAPGPRGHAPQGIAEVVNGDRVVPVALASVSDKGDGADDDQNDDDDGNADGDVFPRMVLLAFLAGHGHRHVLRGVVGLLHLWQRGRGFSLKGELLVAHEAVAVTVVQVARLMFFRGVTVAVKLRAVSVIDASHPEHLVTRGVTPGRDPPLTPRIPGGGSSVGGGSGSIVGILRAVRLAGSPDHEAEVCLGVALFDT